ncbi:Transcriptional regulatory protein AfsQ1 [Acaryochloris thomasi RCC1774]|uniref:Transcriptional regulatory protein AfsQ1 n=1 Tax=Acaryochloris thomasi RCC1774 TaxID=1764569 RepID=A0A2W1JP85_9CYAN|nr:response regulator [Acaryochloris thomasi]PZD75119.1 Transcriptional regulatory protein AfsQ1 [Acaryochloris thomasi RCC1774]
MLPNPTHQTLGTNVETAPAGALRRVLPLNISGRLIAQDPNNPAIFWRVYLSRGDVHFAHSTVGHRERLSYALNRSRLGLNLADLTRFPSDYEFLCYCWQSGQISVTQLRQLLLYLTQEALVQVLALPITQVKFENLVKLDPLLISMPFERAILPIRTLMTQWKDLWTHLGTPFQRPYIHDSHHLAMAVAETHSLEVFHRLKHTLSQNLCLYQIAPHLDMSLTDAAKLLSPFVQKGLLGLNPYQHQPQATAAPTVVCIDADKTAQAQVQEALRVLNHDVLGISEPKQALEWLADHPADLILVNVNLPQIDGYEFCRALRQMPSLKETPIVIFSNPSHSLDRSLARLSGATDCLEQSFQSKAFIHLVNYLTQPSGLPVSTR